MGESDKAHLRVHQAQRQADRDTEKPHEAYLQRDSLLGLVATELHGIPQAQIAVHAYGAQVHYARGAEQHVQADPGEAINWRQREVSCKMKTASESLVANSSPRYATN